MHVFHEFPKWKYHAEHEARIVHSKEAEKALGQGWVDSPAHVGKEAEPAQEIKEVKVEPLKRAPRGRS